MVAIGITTEGYIKEFECSDGILHCYSKDLVSLEIPEGVIYVSCYNNLLTELKVPEGVKRIWCWGNKLSKLILPDSVTMLCCDKGVSGLEEFIDKVNIDLW